MPKLTRRRFLAAFAASLAVLSLRRRAVAMPKERVEPVLSKPQPYKEPVRAIPELHPDGWWVEGDGWMYHPTIGWLHCHQPMGDVKRASWYGPPPPPELAVLDWAEMGL